MQTEEEIQPLIEYSSLQSREFLLDLLTQDLNTDPDFDQVRYKLPFLK